MRAGRFVVVSADLSRAVEVDANGNVRMEGSEREWKVTPAGSQVEYWMGGCRVRRRVFVAGSPEARQVFFDGRVFEMEVSPAGQRRKRGPAGLADSLTAPMPGTVVKLLVEAGQQVRRGDMLIKLEAMKMELPVRAPRDGVVAAVHSREGELVQAGIRLLHLSESEK